MGAVEAWVLYGTLLLRLGSAISVVLPDVYWNMSNNIFSGGGYYLSPNPYDMVTVYCPYYERGTSDLVEYNVLYEVDEDGYNRCDAERGRPLLRCDRPYGIAPNFEALKLTILFQEYSPSPYGLEFKPGRDYYYISTSTGEYGGLNATVGGNCVNGMKMKLSICCKSNADWSESSDTNNEISKETAVPRPDYDFSRTSSAPSWLTGRAASLTASIFTVALAWALTRL
ncbi:ephrin-B2-like isoform X2 [Branchiostoma lanceolatum]|uniref:ephrin-B2-like isoform X2 n=1 Tax=Branchiostoma lanceolatum TaxID=7740 RepID=UPI0034565B6C